MSLLQFPTLAKAIVCVAMMFFIHLCVTSHLELTILSSKYGVWKISKRKEKKIKFNNINNVREK